MDEFSNDVIRGIHISRYVASWNNARGTYSRDRRTLDKYGLFVAWLKSLLINGEHLTEDEVRRIRCFAGNGKLELESSAKEFLKTHGI